MSPIRAAAALAVVAFRAFAPVGAEGQAGIETDRAALEALYTATDGANWTDSTNWLTDAPLSAWHGVTTDDAGRVTGLDLRDNGLTGAIPDALGSLAQLEELNLSWNSLTGSIPDALGSLTKLVVLSLWHNGLTGSVHLIVDADQTDVVGRAYISGAFGLTAHSGGGVNFAHELGHNLGLLHDRYQVHRDEGRAGPHPAYGYVNQRPP